MRSIYIVKCSRSLQDLQFDTDYLSRLTPSEPIRGEGQDGPILKQQYSHIFSYSFIKTFDLIRNMAIFIG